MTALQQQQQQAEKAARPLGARISSISILDHGVAGVLFAACLAAVAPLVTAAEPQATESEKQAQIAVASAQEGSLPDYSRYTHHQLTELGARWDELESTEKRALLREVKLRMARQKGSERVLQIRTQRRYGRLVRRSDGKVLRIETQVVQVTPVNPRQGAAERSFGVGFERRSAASAPEQPNTKPASNGVPDSLKPTPGLQASSKSPSTR